MNRMPTVLVICAVAAAVCTIGTAVAEWPLWIPVGILSMYAVLEQIPAK